MFFSTRIEFNTLSQYAYFDLRRSRHGTARQAGQARPVPGREGEEQRQQAGAEVEARRGAEAGAGAETGAGAGTIAGAKWSVSGNGSSGTGALGRAGAR